MRKQIKTVEDWFEELPEPYREQAMKDHKNTRPERSDRQCYSLGEAINIGIEWGRSEQGPGYWERISTLFS